MSDPTARVLALIECFAAIDERMRDLPVHNPALQVETVEMALDEAGVTLMGVLITPWFMNLVRLPLEPEPLAAGRFGEARMIPLAAGERLFLYGGDPSIGALWAHSLHSPMDAFKSQGQARAAARQALDELLVRDRSPAPRQHGPSRRAFLGGR